MSRSLGVVVPAYEPDLDRLRDYVTAVEAVLDPAAIRIELDAPDEATLAAVESLPAAVNAVPARRGKGAAITAGFEAMATDVLAFADADGSVPATSLAEVIDPVRSGGADLAVGSRRHPRSTIRSHQTRARRWLGDTFAWLARRSLAVPLYDYQCGAKAIDRSTWGAVRAHLYEPGFAWDIELVAMADAVGARIAEVPVVWDDQPGSTVDTLGTAVDLGRALVVTRRRATLLRDRSGAGTAGTGRPGPPLVDRARADDD